MNAIGDKLIDEYLGRLSAASRALPRDQGAELVAEIRGHIDAELQPGASEADVRNTLDRLGTPESIVGAAQPGPPPTRRGAREIFALLFLFTGFPPVIGWFVGVALLLWSPLWSTRQKVLGILIWPGGYFLFGIAMTVRFANAGPSGLPLILVLLAFVAVPLLVATYLYRAAGRQARAGEASSFLVDE